MICSMLLKGSCWPENTKKRKKTATENGNQNRQTFLDMRCQIIFILCIYIDNTDGNCAKKTIDHWQEDKSL